MKLARVATMHLLERAYSQTFLQLHMNLFLEASLSSALGAHSWVLHSSQDCAVYNIYPERKER